MQNDRRRRVQSLHRAFWFDRFDASGNYVHESTPDSRQRMWHAMSFLRGDAEHVRRANAMLRHLLVDPPHHFWSAGVTSILARFHDRLDVELRERLLSKLADALPAEAQQTFRGYNDNFPAMAALAAIVGGEMTGQPEVVKGGLRCLESLRHLLLRRGFLSEYASPTYSAITLTCLAEVVELAKHREAKDLALAGEQRIWFELTGRFHPATSFIAGPHSRAYMVDMCAHLHTSHIALYQVLGDAVWINPTYTAFPPTEGQALHGGLGLLHGHVAWQTTPTYHLPVDAARLALDKPMPCTVEADCEQAAFSRNVWNGERHPITPLAEFQASDSHLVTHMTAEYTLGTSSRPSMDGWQHTAMHLVYRRQPKASIRDVATLFPRYLMDDMKPDRHRHLGNQGRTMCVQHESSAMVLAWPKPAWGDPPQGIDATTQPVSTLKLSLILTQFWSQPNAVWIGDEPCEDWSAARENPEPVFLHDGPVYLALHPLHIDDLGRASAMTIEQVNGFGMINLINYIGSAKTFEYHDLLACRNGFVIEVGHAPDWHSFQAFREYHAAPRISDQWDTADAMRTVRYQRDSMALEIAMSPFSEGIKHRSINNRLVRAPKLILPGVRPSLIPWNGHEC